MTDHVWTKISYATIKSVTLNADGGVEATITEEAQEVAEEHAAYGCWICETPLNADTINTECEPPIIC